MKAKKSPLDLMLPYQRQYHSDTSRFKAWVASRQIGKSFTSAAEPVTSCFEHDRLKRKIDWITLSAGERQALEWLEKAKQWTEAYHMSIADLVEDREGSEALLKSAQIIWPNGSRIIVLPANPNTARGYSGNLTLDEFAFHEDPDAIWRACFPIVTNPLKGELKLRVLSTPNGQGNKFHEVVTRNKQFLVHKTTIHDAVKGGLGVDVDQLREALNDPEGWSQEYECEFADAAAILLPYELIALCESADATQTVSPEYWMTQAQWPIDMGIDFGRKKNLTVAWSNEAVADLAITKEVLELQNTPVPQQVEILSPRIERARRVCLDYTGPGVGLGDYLVEQHGEWKPQEDKFGKIELCTFTASLKQELFPKLRMAFERRELRVPVSRMIREDLHSVHRVASTNGNVTYRAPLLKDSHADRCTALALAVRARSYGVSGGIISSIKGIRVAASRFLPKRWRAQG